jgi:hypothetical protein
MRASHKAWCGIGAGVLIYDALSPQGETLSEAFDGWLEGPGKSLASMGVVLLAVHLLNLIDPQHDPVHLLFAGIKRVPMSIRIVGVRGD